MGISLEENAEGTPFEIRFDSADPVATANSIAEAIAAGYNLPLDQARLGARLAVDAYSVGINHLQRTNEPDDVGIVASAVSMMAMNIMGRGHASASFEIAERGVQLARLWAQADLEEEAQNHAAN
jgi:uncharacterized membrane protein